MLNMMLYVAFVFVFPLITNNHVLAAQFEIECEENQRLMPGKKDYECFNVTRLDENEEPLEVYDSSIKCTCAWFENCKQHIKNEISTNDTVYVNGVRMTKGKTFYKCCWSKYFNYDMETCKNVNDVTKIENIDNGKNVSIMANINRFEKNHLICTAQIEEENACAGIAKYWESENTEWIAGLVLGVVLPLALIRNNIESCPAITAVQGITITYTPADVAADGGYATGTTATYTCPDPPNEQVIYPTAVACTDGSFVDFAVGLPETDLCCTKQYSSCTTDTNCCTGTGVHEDNNGQCVTASDTNMYCSVGAINDDCIDEGSTAQCTNLNYCQSGTCQAPTCDPIDAPLYAIITYSADANDVGKYELDTTATYECADPTTQTILHGDVVVKCTATGFEEFVPDDPTADLCCSHEQYADCSPGSPPCCDDSPPSVNPTGKNAGKCVLAADDVKRCSVGALDEKCDHDSAMYIRQCEQNLGCNDDDECQVWHYCYTRTYDNANLCVQFFSTSLTFNAAEIACQTRGGNLASVQDTTMQTALLQIMRDFGRDGLL